MSVGYTVSGMTSLVDEYVKGKELIGYDSIGGLKSAYIMGHVIMNEVPEGLEITKMDLQKLFVQLTNG